MSEQASIRQAGEAFTRNTATHEMTVLRDDGLYRHLRFRHMAEQKDGSPKPSSSYWFDIITWPGYLVITGDMETFVFARTTDMFEFFRGDRVNPGYWAEKLQAPRPEQVKRYNEALFREHVAEDVAEAEEEWPGLRHAVDAHLLGSSEIYYEHNARVLLDEFEFGGTETATCTCGTKRTGLPPDDAHQWAVSHYAMAPIGSGSHQVTFAHVDGFRFTDAWEWDLSDWTHQFLWCCHAIPWAVKQYDQARAAEAVNVA